MIKDTFKLTMGSIRIKKKQKNRVCYGISLCGEKCGLRDAEKTQSFHHVILILKMLVGKLVKD